MGNHTSGTFPMILEHTTCTVHLNEDASRQCWSPAPTWGEDRTPPCARSAETLGWPIEDVRLETGDS